MSLLQQLMDPFLLVVIVEVLVLGVGTISIHSFIQQTSVASLLCAKN